MVNGNLVFAVAAAVTAGVRVCVAGAQWGQALALGARPSPLATLFDLTGFLGACGGTARTALA
ncbi:hypothetical protein [Lentzea albida]|uniref:hypothetical protein n=1 Tax=Lentzea albida TaxID=65499 RepID=UPI0015A686B6|nr:hypothetical protein [Lentzea albida]